MCDAVLTALVALALVPTVSACALVPILHDLAARRQTRRESVWLAQWRADHTHTQTTKESRA